MEKHCSNTQYFKEKKLQSKIFNQLNVKKLKLTKIILKKKTNKKKGKKGEKSAKKIKWKKNEKVQKKKKRKALWITVVTHSDFGVGNSDSPTPPHHLEYC